MFSEKAGWNSQLLSQCLLQQVPAETRSVCSEVCWKGTPTRNNSKPFISRLNPSTNMTSLSPWWWWPSYSSSARSPVLFVASLTYFSTSMASVALFISLSSCCYRCLPCSTPVLTFTYFACTLEGFAIRRWRDFDVRLKLTLYLRLLGLLHYK